MRENIFEVAKQKANSLQDRLELYRTIAFKMHNFLVLNSPEYRANNTFNDKYADKLIKEYELLTTYPDVDLKIDHN